MAHLGTKVSALLDGRLAAAEEERCWEHVYACHACRDLVEREGWVKTRLAGLSLCDGAAPSGLKAQLLAAAEAPAAGAAESRPFASDHLGTGSRAWPRGITAVGGGALGMAVVGMLALGSSGFPAGTRTPAAEIAEPVTGTSGAVAEPVLAPAGPAAPAPAAAAVALTPIGVVDLVLALSRSPRPATPAGVVGPVQTPVRAGMMHR